MAMSQQANDELPFDQGTAAYDARKHWRENLYPEGTWQHDEWFDGWTFGQKAGANDSLDYATDQFKPVAASK
jgi:hypothetical protein